MDKEDYKDLISYTRKCLNGVVEEMEAAIPERDWYKIINMKNEIDRISRTLEQGE